jgi:hypothetical protein
MKKAARTAKWAITMTRWLVTKTNAGVKWRLVTFVGPGGSESRGIVDLLAIRKDHKTEGKGLKRGDLFEIILIQVKGGAAAWPSADDIDRLRIVGDVYRVLDIVLAKWKKGSQPVFYRLAPGVPYRRSVDDGWIKIDSPDDIFD